MTQSERKGATSIASICLDCRLEGLDKIAQRRLLSLTACMRLQQHGASSLGVCSVVQRLPAPLLLHHANARQQQQRRQPGNRTSPSLPRSYPPVACFSSKHPAAGAAAAAAPAAELTDASAAAPQVSASDVPLPEVLQRMRQACGLQIPAGHEICEEGSGVYLGMPIRWQSCIQVCPAKWLRMFGHDWIRMESEQGSRADRQTDRQRACIIGMIRTLIRSGASV